MCKEAGRPLPRFSADDVVDYLVTEAVVAKHGRELEKERKAAERAEWKGKRDHLKRLG